MNGFEPNQIAILFYSKHSAFNNQDGVLSLQMSNLLLLRESTNADRKRLKIAFSIANYRFRLTICNLTRLLDSRDSSRLPPVRCVNETKTFKKFKNRQLAMFNSYQPVRIHWPWSTLSVCLHLSREWQLDRKCISISKTMVYLPQVSWPASCHWVWTVPIASFVWII